MRAAVVGHLEWVQFLRVPALPGPGDIVHASEGWAVPAGGGTGTAMQLLRLTDDTVFYTALGDDELGRRAARELDEMGLSVRVAWREEPTRCAFTHITSDGERTITVLGERLGPRGNDDLGWEELAGFDCVYISAGDVAAVHHARRAPCVVATARAKDVIARAGIALDGLVGSEADPAEAYTAGDLDPAPALVVKTRGSAGGIWATADEERAFEAPPLKRPIVDRYGAGDAFAGGLTYALGARMEPREAVALAAACGAAAVTGRGPFEAQLTRRDLGLPAERDRQR